MQDALAEVAVDPCREGLFAFETCVRACVINQLKRYLLLLALPHVIKQTLRHDGVLLLVRRDSRFADLVLRWLAGCCHSGSCGGLGCNDGLDGVVMLGMLVAVLVLVTVVLVCMAVRVLLVRVLLVRVLLVRMLVVLRGVSMLGCGTDVNGVGRQQEVNKPAGSAAATAASSCACSSA